MTIPTLLTERLTLRGFRLSDAPEVQRLAGDYEIADTTINIPHPYANGMAESWIESHEGNYRERKGVTFAITANLESCLVGAISLMRIEQGHQAEVGYWVGKQHWGNGYCTEAGNRIVDFAFNQLGLFRLHARHMARNPASGRVLKKIGFEYEGLRKSHAKKWDQFEHLVDYGLIKQSNQRMP